MKKKNGKGKKPRARAVKDLPVSDAKARQSKGGFLGALMKPVVGVAKPLPPSR